MHEYFKDIFKSGFGIVNTSLGMFFWFLELVIIDDTNLWHLDSADFWSDINRLGLFLGSAMLASILAYLVQAYLWFLFKDSWPPKQP